MKKRILPLLLALALLLTGCASLLERRYAVVEPYTNRYRDTAAEDTLRAESYQDLVNSLLMLVEQRAEEGVIRYYAAPDADAYLLAMAARREVRQETVLGAYLLRGVTLTFSGGESYSTLAFTMTYRQEAEDPESLMVLSDTQSLVDLLRMSVREGHEKLTARFFVETAREDVEAAVKSLWQELHQAEAAPTEDTEPAQTAEGETAGPGEPGTAEGETTDPGEPGTTEGETAGPDEPGTAEGETAAPGEPGTAEGETADPGEPGTAEGAAPVSAEAPVEYPPCPWEVRFYPDRETAEIVEILLAKG